MEGGRALRSELDSTLSAPASLASPQGNGHAEALANGDDFVADDGLLNWPEGIERQLGHTASSMDKVRSWKVELPQDQRSLRDGERYCLSPSP